MKLINNTNIQDDQTFVDKLVAYAKSTSKDESIQFLNEYNADVSDAYSHYDELDIDMNIWLSQYNRY